MVGSRATIWRASSTIRRRARSVDGRPAATRDGSASARTAVIRSTARSAASNGSDLPTASIRRAARSAAVGDALLHPGTHEVQAGRVEHVLGSLHSAPKGPSAHEDDAVPAPDLRIRPPGRLLPAPDVVDHDVSRLQHSVSLEHEHRPQAPREHPTPTSGGQARGSQARPTRWLAESRRRAPHNHTLVTSLGDSSPRSPSPQAHWLSSWASATRNRGSEQGFPWLSTRLSPHWKAVRASDARHATPPLLRARPGPRPRAPPRHRPTTTPPRC